MTTVTVTLKPITCADCGVIFGLEETYRGRRMDDHKTFYCPSGHANVYTGKTTEEKLREQLKDAEHRKDWWRERAEQKEADAKLAEYRRRAAKGQLTKLKNRAAAGQCPCCDRYFYQLHEHMKAEHPDFLEDDDDAEGTEAAGGADAPGGMEREEPDEDIAPPQDRAAG